MTPPQPLPDPPVSPRLGSTNWIAFALCVAYLAVMAMLMWVFESAQTLVDISAVPVDPRRLNVWLLIFITTGLIFLGARWFLSRLVDRPDGVTAGALARRRLGAPTMVLLSLASLIAGSGWFVVHEQEDALKASRFRLISSVAESKRQVVTAWLDERQRDLRTLTGNARLQEAVAQLLSPPPATVPGLGLSALEAMVRANGFDGAALVDASGQLRLSSPPDHAASQACVARAQQAPSSDESQLTLTRAVADAQGVPHLDAVARMDVDAGGVKTRATLCLSLDLSVRLLPELSHWPLPTQTGEILLGRFDGADVVLLNRSRSGPNDWTVQRLDNARARWEATLAATAAEQLLERELADGHTMLRVSLAVPATNWFVLARMDEEEADLLQGRTQRRIVAGAGLALIFAVGVAMLGWARSRARAIAHTREREALLVKLTSLAHYDDLTQLPRRQLTEDRLTMAIAQARRDGTGVGVLVVDLDGFKAINDTYGHAAGDAVLQTVAERLQARLREGDTAGRTGGDEFIVVLPGCADLDALVHAGLGVAEALNAPLSWNGQTLAIRASVGGAAFPLHASNRVGLTEAADQAMYVAKQSGGGFHSAPPDLLSTS